ncbi:DUF4440 domain-containing protein [Fulvivirgaceae bacterium PWU4]|uniref:DUF4440 domain-containing protein n=1 Tax=Chryseosolibacter histidini TaxID=2782349 RepID=A0AAP2DKR6_9BACT|nr:nuclear transport factor 2 family protein [Chryseosolibacter histidini]MBT1696777.1 DUF4440 domain-containing protein [Chryseosolibacter histidini]
MKTILLIIMSLSVLNHTSLAQSQDEKEVAAAVESLRKAMIDASESSLKDLTSDALSYGHSSGMVEDKAGFIGRLLSGESDFKTITLSDQTIKINNNVAIVRHRLVAETSDNGKPGNPNLSVLLVWQKDKGKWKLVARQAVKNQ